MKEKTKSIRIYRTPDGRFSYNSPTYDNLDVTECELMVLLGATIGVTITDKKTSNCSWRIDITKIYHE